MKLTVLMRIEIALLYMRNSNREKAVRCQIVLHLLPFPAYHTLNRNANALHNDAEEEKIGTGPSAIVSLSACPIPGYARPSVALC
jgi:hypothetical protein